MAEPLSKKYVNEGNVCKINVAPYRHEIHGHAIKIQHDPLNIVSLSSKMTDLFPFALFLIM